MDPLLAKTSLIKITTEPEQAFGAPGVGRAIETMVLAPSGQRPCDIPGRWETRRTELMTVCAGSSSATISSSADNAKSRWRAPEWPSAVNFRNAFEAINVRAGRR